MKYIHLSAVDVHGRTHDILVDKDDYKEAEKDAEAEGSTGPAAFFPPQWTEAKLVGEGTLVYDGDDMQPGMYPPQFGDV